MSDEKSGCFWRDSLKESRLVVAPMVDASELAWRILSRRYGAELCYTPMLHSHVFVKDARYRRENLASCPEDRPLIVQFCANDPDTFVAACKLAAPHCDAVDLNLGCPQAIARKGHYGAFLQDEWDLVATMIKRASSEVDIPVTAKIRVFDDTEKTVKYARTLENAGVSLLTVHGRTRNQKGPLTGLASWDKIKAVKEAVKVPVFANGNIQYLDDVWKCIEATGVEGVMSAEGNLHNPAIFKGTHPPVWQMALEYLELVDQYPCPPSYTRGHLFKLLHHCLCMPENFDIRHRLSKTSTPSDMAGVVRMLKERMEPYHLRDKPWTPEPDSDQARLPFPPWMCQPYVRIPPEQHLKKVKESQEKALEKARLQKEQNEEEGNLKEESDSSKRPMVDEAEGDSDLSKKKKKKMVRNPNKSFSPGEQYDKCACKNPKGGRCAYELCRKCCRLKCYTYGLDCPGHRILVKTKREKAAIYYGQQEEPKDESGVQEEAQKGDLKGDLMGDRKKRLTDEKGETHDENKMEGGQEDSGKKENEIGLQDEMKTVKMKDGIMEDGIMKDGIMKDGISGMLGNDKRNEKRMLGALKEGMKEGQNPKTTQQNGESFMDGQMSNGLHGDKNEGQINSEMSNST